MMHDQAEKLRQLALSSNAITKGTIIKKNCHSNNSRVITVTSGKGGVGKTNFTINLALALADLKQNVLVIDADLGMANIGVVLGCSTPYSLLNLLEDSKTMGDIVSDGPRGIKFIAGGSGMYHLANLSEIQLQYIIRQISFFDDWADFILIDTGAGLSKNVLNFVMAADEVIVITTPEPTAITDAYAMMKVYAGNQGYAPLRLVVNRITELAEGQMVVDKLTQVSLRFLTLPVNNLGFVFEDRNMVKAVKMQTPLLISFPQSIASRCIQGIASRLLKGEKTAQPSGIRVFLEKIFNFRR
ncbi:MAG TPA: MinD/ParA family protein [Methylomusa anaerophila]|uniref:Flagellum site-determining protein YlxH n=1 Tax=Methylomusa anaerophila TaxID=1930071 RepID=A0A348AQ18_9FIRM|nr:MinD/ParA family protein [Methylomusa anaerophila]BBB93166.1 flagellum site-determining protein YlxH [Methylomusa anaerophila]HML87002.1 MinD/ParA family protein [Methylomusa anaerophila]